MKENKKPEIRLAFKVFFTRHQLSTIDSCLKKYAVDGFKYHYSRLYDSYSVSIFEETIKSFYFGNALREFLSHRCNDLNVLLADSAFECQGIEIDAWIEYFDVFPSLDIPADCIIVASSINASISIDTHIDT